MDREWRRDGDEGDYLVPRLDFLVLCLLFMVVPLLVINAYQQYLIIRTLNFNLSLFQYF